MSDSQAFFFFLASSIYTDIYSFVCLEARTAYAIEELNMDGTLQGGTYQLPSLQVVYTVYSKGMTGI